MDNAHQAKRFQNLNMAIAMPKRVYQLFQAPYKSAVLAAGRFSFPE